MVLEKGVFLVLKKKKRDYKIIGVRNYCYIVEFGDTGFSIDMPVVYYGVELKLTYTKQPPNLKWKNQLVNEVSKGGGGKVTAYKYWYPPEFNMDGIFYKVPIDIYDEDNPEKMLASSSIRSKERKPNIEPSIDIWAEENRKEFTKIPIEGTVCAIYVKSYNSVKRIKPSLNLTKKGHIKRIFKEEIWVLLQNRCTYFKVPLRLLTFLT